MEALANFFEWINRMLGVWGAGELVFHPVFIGICVALFIYGVATGKRFLGVGIGGLLGGALIFHYLYPHDSSALSELLKFIVAMGALALLIVYFGFIRE